MRLLRPLLSILLIVIFATPYLWMLGSTFKNRDELFADLRPLSVNTFIPREPTLANLAALLTETAFAGAFANSLIIASLTVVLSLIIDSMIAYVLAWLEFPGRRLLFIAILATLMIAFEARLIPLFLTVQSLGLDNTLPAIFLPWLGDAFAIFLFRQHFRELPRDLFEAALIDGCSYTRLYWNVMLPNIIPALVSIGFIRFVFAWDAFLWPLVISPTNHVLTVAIARLFSDEAVRWELAFAGSCVATLPVVLLFVFLQRYYVEGFLHSGLN